MKLLATCKDYRAFADVKLPRPERVQANDKLCKVELLRRAGHRVKVFLASDVPLLPASHGVGVSGGGAPTLLRTS